MCGSIRPTIAPKSPLKLCYYHGEMEYVFLNSNGYNDDGGKIHYCNIGQINRRIGQKNNSNKKVEW